MELHIIEIPMWLQYVLSVVSLWLLWKLMTFSDTNVRDCGWCGHQGDDND